MRGNAISDFLEKPFLSKYKTREEPGGHRKGRKYWGRTPEREAETFRCGHGRSRSLGTGLGALKATKGKSTERVLLRTCGARNRTRMALNWKGEENKDSVYSSRTSKNPTSHCGKKKMSRALQKREKEIGANSLRETEVGGN